MSRAPEGLRINLSAGDVGRGGDGRELSPRDNGGPEIIEKPHGNFPFVGLSIVGLLIGTGGVFYINRDFINDYLRSHGYTPEQLAEKILEALTS